MDSNVGENEKACLNIEDSRTELSLVPRTLLPQAN